MFPACVYPRCLFSLIYFEIRCIGRVLLVLGSRLKNEENMRVFLCFSSMIIYTDAFWNSFYWQSTVISRLTLKERGIHTRFSPSAYPRCLVSLHAAYCDENASGPHHYKKMKSSDGNSTCHVVNTVFHSPNRTNRPNRQACEGSSSPI